VSGALAVRTDRFISLYLAEMLLEQGNDPKAPCYHGSTGSARMLNDDEPAQLPLALACIRSELKWRSCSWPEPVELEEESALLSYQPWFIPRYLLFIISAGWV
jgi:hypothetical protein